MSLKAQVAAGEITGAQGDGRINSASRADLAAGAAEVLVNGKGGDIYELAGDHGWTLGEFAAEVSRQSGTPVAYRNLGEEDYAQSLVEIGFPEYIAKVIANSGYSTSLGALEESWRHARKADRPPDHADRGNDQGRAGIALRDRG